MQKVLAVFAALVALSVAAAHVHADAPQDEPGRNITNLKHTWSAGQAGAPVTLAINTATFTPDFSTGNNFNITLVHASCPCTIATPLNIVAGMAGQIVVNQSSSGSDTVTYGSVFKFPSGTAPTLSTAASAVDILSYYVIDATHIAISSGLNFQ
jgi:hypothetical protein